MRAPVLLSLLVLAACGDDRPVVAGAAGEGTSLVPNDGGATPPVDGGAATCEALAVEATPVGETFVNAAQAPDPLGGALPTGTFVLADVTRFERFTGVRDDETGETRGVPTSDALVSKVLVLDGATYRFATRTGTVSSGVVGAAETTGGTWTTNGTSVALRQSCPTTAATSLLGFSVVGDSVAIYTSATRRETYVPAP